MEFELKSEQGYGISFHSQEHDEKGWLSYYCVTLTAPTMSATIKVDNAPYGTPPTGLFEQMANEWQGWKGEKSWGSLEGEFDLKATSDSTGHITLVASLYSGSFPPCSKMVSEFEIESGQLEKHKNYASEFFK